jgi:hypothetical protein
MPYRASRPGRNIDFRRRRTSPRQFPEIPQNLIGKILPPTVRPTRHKLPQRSQHALEALSVHPKPISLPRLAWLERPDPDGGEP